MSSSFEWLELETLSRDIATLEDRLHAAKSTKNHGLMRLLEQQLSQAKSRRPIILEAITRHAAHSAAIPAPAKPSRQKKPSVADIEEPTAAAVEQITVERVTVEKPIAEYDAPPPDAEIARTVPEIRTEIEEQPGKHRLETAAAPGSSNSTEGANIVWNQLTPDHLEQAKRELAKHRAEMLARHAEELKGLEAEQGEIDTLAQAITAFTKKFAPAEGGEVVQLDEERGQRLQA